LQRQVKDATSLNDRELDKIKQRGDSLAEKVVMLEKELLKDQQNHIESLEIVLRENEDLKS
jgi:hypothetical protein